MSDFGRLSSYFKGASTKRLSAVECDSASSNQHELNGTKAMREVFGSERHAYPATFIRIDDNPDKTSSDTGTVTWYDAREEHPTRSEFRFYYQNTPALELANADDPLVVVLKNDDTVLYITAAKGSQSELELFELFGDIGDSSSFAFVDFYSSDKELSASTRLILDALGIDIKADFGTNYLDKIAERFNGLRFPSTKEFSLLAREIAGASGNFDSADDALIGWWDTEEAMFLQLEEELINQKLNSGFESVEDFLSFSQSIRQRRSSRAGHALENHLAQLFDDNDIRYSWGKKTENNKTPDFIFPSIEDYLDHSFNEDRLTMLAVKTTCKDRWRQVLNEANRISVKHLLTLQPKISENQTSEMAVANLQLVVPSSIHSTYTNEQRNWLYSLEEFITKLAM